jgi:hypothetical protein
MPAVLDVDDLASRLAQVGQTARAMAPSYQGGGYHFGFTGQGGECLGRVLPGVGLVLNMDGASLGLHRLPSDVYDRSTALRVEELQTLNWSALVDLADGEKTVGWTDLKGRKRRLVQGGAVSGYDGIISGRAAGKGQEAVVMKPFITTVANAWSSIMGAVGLPVALVYTALPNGAVMTNVTVGALSQGLTNPTGTDKKYLLTWGYSSATQINMACLVDLLVAVGAIPTNTVTTAQTINSVALTRQTSGTGVMVVFEITTALGVTASNMTVTYTNQSGTAARSTGAIALTPSGIVGRLQPIATVQPFMPLQSGDFGVRSVETFTVSALMGAGQMALHLALPLHFVPGIAANAYVERDSTTQIDGITELQNASLVLGCLAMYVLPNTTSAGPLVCFFRTVAG